MSLLTSLTYVLPHRFLSSLARRLAYSTSPGTKQWLIDTVTRKFDVDLSEAAVGTTAIGARWPSCSPCGCTGASISLR